MTGNKQLTDLIAAVELALESDGGTRYESEDDDCGSHACCLVVSYKPHANDCWVPRLRSALAAPAAGKGVPVAWSRAEYICDADGRPIGTDEPRVVWGSENPDPDEAWHPLYSEAASAVETGVDDANERQPDGYAYRYADGFIRHNGGREHNGMRPTETIPFYYGATALTRQPVAGDGYQDRVGVWMDACFPRALYGDMTQRCDRFLEEALELLQSMGYDRGRVATLVDYVWGRPVGDPKQEVGGTVVTLAALCWVAGIDMHGEAQRELERIERPEVMAKIRAKQEAKNALHFDSPLPGAAPAATPTDGGEGKNG